MRQLISVLGVTSLDDLIGRKDLLEPREVKLAKTNTLDMLTINTKDSVNLRHFRALAETYRFLNHTVEGNN